MSCDGHHRWRMQKKFMRYPAEQTAAKHERIVKEASRLFRERGFENVSVGEVIKAAGLTNGAFYAHFGSKEETAGGCRRLWLKGFAGTHAEQRRQEGQSIVC